MSEARVPVHVLSGFLGAGKTTALLHLLASRPGERAAVIVNDFGEARIDAERVQGAPGVAIADIPGLCVCCTAPEGFASTVLGLLDGEAPDRLYIEPTGLARPADLVDTIRRAPWANRVALGPVVVLVDPRQITHASADGPFLREQAEAADVLVASRTDLCQPEDLERFSDWAGQLWPGPHRTLQIAHGALPGEVLDWAEGEGPRRRFSAVVSVHEPQHVARSLAWPPDVVFAKERLSDALAQLVVGRAGASLSRLKGVFRTEQGTVRIEVAAGRIDERLTAFRRDSRVDIILAGTDPEPLDRAEGWLQEARATAEELQRDGSTLELVFSDGTRAEVDRATLAALPHGVEDISSLIPGRSGSAARLSVLFEALGRPLSGEAVVVAADGYATPAVPADALGKALLLHSIHGEALPGDKGGPLRLLIPGDAGPAGACSNVKGVVQLVLRAD